MTNWLIVGASRGLGDAFARGLGVRSDVMWLVSRTRPESAGVNDGVERNWIEADLNDPPATARSVADSIGDNELDVVIYNAGCWEAKPFDEMSNDEISTYVNVNLTSAVTISQAVLNNVASAKGRIVFIGSTASLDNVGSQNVAYVAAKSGLRAAAASLREIGREKGIAVTSIVPGSIASDVSFADGVEAALSAHDSQRIPVADVVNLVSCVLSLSTATCVKEIVVPALADDDV